MTSGTLYWEKLFVRTDKRLGDGQEAQDDLGTGSAGPRSNSACRRMADIIMFVSFNREKGPGRIGLASGRSSRRAAPLKRTVGTTKKLSFKLR